MIELFGKYLNRLGNSPLIILTKPSITLMAVLVTGGGMLLSQRDASISTIFFSLFGTALAVSSAMVLNQYLEIDVDSLMNRTKNRPLPTGRVKPSVALRFGLLLGVCSLVFLAFGVNLLTALLGLIALVSYTVIYTPLKKHTPLALLVGSLPGAMPALMGWTAATNRIDLPGLILFFVMLVWQIPHFMAIAVMHRDDYLRAGIKTVPFTRGKKAAEWETLAFTLILIPISLSLFPLGIGGFAYISLVSIGGLMLLYVSISGFNARERVAWARKFFFATLLFLPLLSLGLIIDWVLKI